MSFRTLDLNLLKVFEALMTEGTVTRAAARLSLTQPTVSNALARLRESFGDPLFVRGKSGVNPTQRAIALWGPIGELLSQLRGTLDEQRFPARDARASFCLSMSDYVAAVVMPALLQRFGRSAPAVEVHAMPNLLLDAPALLENNRIDGMIGVYLNESLLPPQIRSRALWTVEHACLMRRGHPLAAAGKLTTRRFLAARHVDVSLAGKTQPSYDAFLASLGLHRNLVSTVNHYAVACEVLRHTDLIAVLPSDLCERAAADQGLVRVRAPLEAPARVVSLFWHQRNDTVAAHRWLREQVIEAFGEG